MKSSHYRNINLKKRKLTKSNSNNLEKEIKELEKKMNDFEQKQDKKAKVQQITWLNKNIPKVVFTILGIYLFFPLVLSITIPFCYYFNIKTPLPLWLFNLIKPISLFISNIVKYIITPLIIAIMVSSVDVAKFKRPKFLFYSYLVLELILIIFNISSSDEFTKYWLEDVCSPLLLVLTIYCIKEKISILKLTPHKNKIKGESSELDSSK